MRSNFEDICDFHIRFGLEHNGIPKMLDEETARFRAKFMYEELEEFVDSYHKKDLAGMADALIDLTYVAMGTAYMMGLPWQDLWDEVQRANMSKVRATDASQSKRGSSLDVVKPEGWQAPNIDGILNKYI